MAKRPKQEAFAKLIAANYTAAERLALARWADEMEALTLRKKP